jgi:hypothetical protein
VTVYNIHLHPVELTGRDTQHKIKPQVTNSSACLILPETRAVVLL